MGLDGEEREQEGECEIERAESVIYMHQLSKSSTVVDTCLWCSDVLILPVDFSD